MNDTILASDLRAAYLAELDAVALRSAEDLIRQGWTADPSTYDLGAFPGDLEAAEAVNDLHFTPEERREHEARIRGHLASMRRPIAYAIVKVDSNLPTTGEIVDVYPTLGQCWAYMPWPAMRPSGGGGGFVATHMSLPVYGGCVPGRCETVRIESSERGVRGVVV